MTTYTVNEVLVVDALRANNGSLWRDAMEREMDLKKSTLYVALRSLREKNIIDFRRSGKHYQYFLTEYAGDLDISPTIRTLHRGGAGTLWDNADKEAMRLHKLAMAYMTGTAA